MQLANEVEGHWLCLVTRTASTDVWHLHTVEVRNCSNPWILTGLYPQVLANLFALARLGHFPAKSIRSVDLEFSPDQSCSYLCAHMGASTHQCKYDAGFRGQVSWLSHTQCLVSGAGTIRRHRLSLEISD